MRNENDVGAGWRKRSKKNVDYISISLDVDRLLELSGGATGKLNLVCFLNTSSNPKAPDFQLMYFPPENSRPREARREPPPRRASFDDMFPRAEARDEDAWRGRPADDDLADDRPSRRPPMTDDDIPF